MNSSLFIRPCSTSFNLYSHSPVISGDCRISIPKASSVSNNPNAFAVGTSSRPIRRTYSSEISVSMVAARVAGVPKPLSPIASRNASSSNVFPAPSMALSSVASVIRAGGFVCNPSAKIATVLTLSPSTTGTSNFPSSPPPSSAASFPYTANQPASFRIFPSVRKACPSTRVIRFVTS